MIIDFPMRIKTTRCETASRTEIKPTRHGVCKSVVKVKPIARDEK